MIPLDIRLYTWLDIEDVLLRSRKQEKWPEGLVWARSYWNGLTLGVRPGTHSSVKTWLQGAYEPRLQVDSQYGDIYIILESIQDNQRALPVFFQETEEEPPIPRLIRSLDRSTIIWRQGENLQLPNALQSDLPCVAALYPTESNVGQTTHALALAKELTVANKRVLLIDGNLDPSINQLRQSRLSFPSICLADFIALIHEDFSSGSKEVIDLVAERLKDSLVNGIYFLPSFRGNNKLIDVKLKRLTRKNYANPFFLTDALALLGKSLGVDVVLVDLKPGFSDLALLLISDPRVHRAVLSIASRKAISKIRHLFSFISPSIFRSEALPPPALVLTKSIYADHDQHILNDAASVFFQKRKDTLAIMTPSIGKLENLPDDQWKSLYRISNSELPALMHPFLSWLYSYE
ncbi:hypothetical protein [Moorena sp. SIO2C4]|uniref:hypothetical protein n=1 Tax=Moorena sp. SIO2C4 TaxID=2607824 RepID=UPI0013C9BCA6|nr:hypothetical protein [Moorena sp. SIO2C4]NES40536.1 ParA family protein [Moorena sp. SIO2C4]